MVSLLSLLLEDTRLYKSCVSCIVCFCSPLLCQEVFECLCCSVNQSQKHLQIKLSCQVELMRLLAEGLETCLHMFLELGLMVLDSVRIMQHVLWSKCLWLQSRRVGSTCLCLCSAANSCQLFNWLIALRLRALSWVLFYLPRSWIPVGLKPWIIGG